MTLDIVRDARPVCALFVFVAFLLSAQTARAEPELFVSLEYRTDPALSGCPSAADFRQMVTAELGYDPFRNDAGEKIAAEALGSERGIEGSVRWSDANGRLQGERRLSLESRDCAEFARAMTFAIAVQIQLLSSDVSAPPDAPSDAAAGPNAGARSTPAGPPASVPPGREEAPARESTAPAGAAERQRWQWLAGVGSSAGFGMAPTVAAEGRIFLALRDGALSGELGGEASLPSAWRNSDGSGFDHNVAALAVAGCGHLGVLSGCALGKVGQIHVHGFGVDEPRSSSGLLAQAGARVAVAGAVGTHVLGTFRVEVLGTLAPWTVALNQRDVWTTPPATLLIGVDLAAALP